MVAKYGFSCFLFLNVKIYTEISKNHASQNYDSNILVYITNLSRIIPLDKGSNIFFNMLSLYPNVETPLDR